MAENDTDIPTDILKAIDTCCQQCDTVIKNFENTINAQPTPPVLYHYTDSTGLLGILKSGKIRLTDVFGLNDTSELFHGVKLAHEILSAEVQQKNSPATTSFADRFYLFSNEGVEEAANIFATCFSCDKDDLGQWRAYGDNGRGYAIGFDCGLIESAFLNKSKEHVSSGSFPITYKDNLLRKIHQQLVSEVLPLVERLAELNLSDNAIIEIKNRLLVHLSVSVISASVLFKHEAYENEQEYRFLQAHPKNHPIEDLMHLARRYSLVRFNEFEWNTKGQHVLREIVIGPAADESAAKSFALECLSVGGFESKEEIIRTSKIPYRCT